MANAEQSHRTAARMTSPAPDESLAAQVLKSGYRGLSFPAPLEQQYREDHRANVHRLVRMSLVVSCITSAGFAFMDHWVIHAVNAMPDLVRFGLQLPVLIIALLATSRRFYLRWYEIAISVGLPLFGLGTVIMTTYAEQANMPLVGGRLLLVVFFCYFMLGLRFRNALACNAVVFASLLIVILAKYLPLEMGLYLAFALLCANFIGAVGAYALEHANRTAFLERLSLEEMAARDGLTRLLNRQTFEFRARNVWRNATTLQRPVSIVMIDVDYFKRYNDCYGHQAGDDCLRRIAQAVREAVNPSRDELVARYGGEELIALLIDRDNNAVEAAVRGIVEHVRAQAIPHSASMVGEFVSVSVGATYPTRDGSIPFNILASVADQALYKAKNQGRNRYTLLSPTENTTERETEGVTRSESHALLQSDRSLTGTAAI